MEANWQHIGTDGISDGHQLQFRRMTLFVASSISKRIKFLSEIEFEPADKEIAIEFAAVDMEFNELFNLRGGMIINPIGAFNQNHDGPKWEFTDRPLSSVSLLPATSVSYTHLDVYKRQVLDTSVTAFCIASSILFGELAMTSITFTMAIFIWFKML